MAVYRYSAAGVERLARKAVRQTSLILGLALLAGTLIPFLNGAVSRPLTLIPILMILSAAVLWSGWRAGKRALEIARLTEFEINGSLTARYSIGCTTFTEDEVAEIRYLKDGVLVRGKGFRKTLLLKPEIEGYEDLVKRIEEWIPPGVPRVRSSGSFSRWVRILVLTNIGLVIAGYLSNPRIAIPASAVEGAVLIGCVIWVWSTEQVTRQLKWMMLFALLPAISMLSRAYLLWTQR